MIHRVLSCEGAQMLFKYDISLVALSPTRSPGTGANSFPNIGLHGSYPYALSLVPLVCLRFPTVALEFLILHTLSQRFPAESFSRFSACFCLSSLDFPNSDASLAGS